MVRQGPGRLLVELILSGTQTESARIYSGPQDSGHLGHELDRSSGPGARKQGAFKRKVPTFADLRWAAMH
eukprot:7669577-Pyramimonas_sp.AAC.1